MSYELPAEITAIIAEILKSGTLTGLQNARGSTSALYKENASSAGSTRPLSSKEESSYLAVRMPATFAANLRTFEILSKFLEKDNPTSILDLGSGPGTASLAALNYLNSVSEITFVERSAGFLEAAKLFCEGASFKVNTANKNLTDPSPLPTADLVIASYSTNELSEEELPSLIERAWTATNSTFVVVEPGTKAGFKNILNIRDQLIKMGARIAAPCPHSMECPMKDTEKWCHFRVRFNRSRLHKIVKDAVLSYEDEPFSFMAFTKKDSALSQERLTSFPRKEKGFIKAEICGFDGKLSERRFLKRNKEEYENVRNLTWGDGL
jgi:ribosomal protein RSM22 (predicted rRNA methylase)